MKQKLLTLFALLLGVCSGAWAASNVSASGNTWPDANCWVFDGSASQKGAITFSVKNGQSLSGNGGSKGCIFNGNTWNSSCMKGDSKGNIIFTTTATSTITIVTSLKDTGNNRAKVGIYLNKNIKSKNDVSTMVYQTISNATHTDIVNPTSNSGTNSEIRIYKFYNMEAGDYEVHKGPDCQTSIAYIGVTYETTTPYTITTAMDNGGGSTITGGGNYFPNDTVKLTATPGGGKAFDKWVRSTDSAVLTDNPLTIIANANKTYTAYFTDAATKGITAASSNGTYGSVEATATTVAEGGSTTLTATPASEAYYFVNWTKSSDGSWSRNTNSLTINYDDLTDGETYTANFNAYYKITYSVGTYSKGTQTSYQNGTMTKYASSIGQIIMPTNYAFVYSDDFDEAASHTLWAWNNGGGNHVAGGNYTISSDELNYVPVFTTNTVSLAADLTAPQTVTWNFASNAAAPDVHVEGNTGYYVVQTTIKEKEIDVPMYITGAKFNMGETRAQVNATTNFKVPAVKGMLVTYTADNGSPTEADFGFDDAENISFSAEGKIATITYTGTNSSLTISDKNGNFWPKSLAITYPASSIAISTLSGRNYASYVTTNKLDFASAEGITAFIATGLNGGKDAVVLEEVDIVPAGTPIIVKTETKGATVNVPVTTAEPSDVSANKLVAGDGTTDATGSTYYYLASDQFHLATSGKLQSGKAYLEIPASARDLSITFGDATDIGATLKNKEIENKEVYNLSGQRVAQPKKGLYIQSGKKVIIK